MRKRWRYLLVGPVLERSGWRILSATLPLLQRVLSRMEEGKAYSVGNVLGRRADVRMCGLLRDALELTKPK